MRSTKAAGLVLGSSCHQPRNGGTQRSKTFDRVRNGRQRNGRQRNSRQRKGTNCNAIAGNAIAGNARGAIATRVWGVLDGSLTPPHFFESSATKEPAIPTPHPGGDEQEKRRAGSQKPVLGFLGALSMHFCAFSRAFCPWDLIPSVRDSRWVFLGRMVARPTNFQYPNPPPPTPVAFFFF